MLRRLEIEDKTQVFITHSLWLATGALPGYAASTPKTARARIGLCGMLLIMII